MSLFNCITFAETTITKVEKQFIQQQQEQEQQEKHQQVQIQAEQTVHRKTKTKTHKKHTDLIQQEPQQKELSSTAETFAKELYTESLNIERLEHIEDVLQQSTTLAMQNLPQSTHEIVVIAELSTELSTPKPSIAQVKNDILPEKALVVNEECLPFEEVRTGVDQSRPVASKLNKQIVAHDRQAASVTEIQTKESSKEFKSSKIPKLVKADRKMKELRPIVIDVPHVTDSVEDLELLKAVTQQAQKGEIILTHELTSEQQSTFDTVDSLKDLPMSSERAKIQFMEKEGLLVTESFRGETVDKEVSQVVPSKKQISSEIIPNISLDISEYQPENSVEELQPTAVVHPETSSSSLQEYIIICTSESKTLESVEELTQGYKPTKSLADVTFKPEDIPILIEEVQELDTLSEEILKRQPVESKALQEFVLTEGLISTITDTQSPIEENLPTYETATQEAQLGIKTQSHIFTQEIVFDEEYPSNLAPCYIPKNVDAKISQTKSLTIGETHETNLVETTENLIKPTIEPTMNLAETLTQPFGIVMGNQNISYETVGTIDKVETNINQGIVNITGGELVAEVQSQIVIDSEQAFITEIPEKAKGKLGFVQQKALDVKQDTVIERENKLVTEGWTSEHAASDKIVPSELRVTSIMEIQPQLIATDMENASIMPTSAFQSFETKPIGVASEHEPLESTAFLKVTQQPKGKSGQLLLYENLRPLEISDVQITETSTDLIDSTHTELTAKMTTNTFAHAENSEVLLLESTSKYAIESTPTSALAELTMPAQYGTDTMQQDTLETFLPHSQESLPYQHISETTFDVLQPLETGSIFSLEQETSIEAAVPRSVESAVMKSNPALQVANKSSLQHLETSKELDANTERQHHALVNIREITIPEYQEVIPLVALNSCLTPAFDESKVCNVEIIENPSALNNTTTIACEETTDIFAPFVVQQNALSPKLSDLNVKSPLIEETNVLDYASELTSYNSTLEQSHSTISSFKQINVLETQTFEKETGLEEIKQPIGQLVNVSVDSTSTGIILNQQSTYESEHELTVSIVPLEHAKAVTSEMLRIPMTEGVIDNQSIEDLTDFDVSSKLATSSFDVLNETKITEVLVLDSTLTTAVKSEPECQSSQTIVPHKHTLITEPVVISSVNEFETTLEKPFKAITTRNNPSQLPVLEERNIYEAESRFNAESSQELSANISNIVPTLLTKDVNEPQVYDSIRERKPSDKFNSLHAEISHAMTIVPTKELQDFVQAEEIFTSEAPIIAAASTSDIISKLQVSLNTSINVLEDANVLSTPSVNKAIACSSLEGQNYEVTVTDSQCAEDSVPISAPNVVSVRAIESMNEFLKTSPELIQENVFQKESYIPATANNKIKAKLGLSEILQSTTTAHLVTFEETEPIKPTETIMHEAKVYPYVISDANKFQTKHEDLILQKEELFLDSHPVGYGKQFIDGTVRETLVLEITPIESVGDIETTKTSNIEAELLITETQIHKTTSQVETFEKTEDLKEDRISETHLVNIQRETEANCAKLTTTIMAFIKEDNLPPLRLQKETAEMPNLENEPLITEEIMSIAPIKNENYELRIPTAGTAKIIHETKNKVATLTEQLIFEESLDMEFESRKYSTSKVDLVESSTGSLQTSTVNVFENIEKHGDFRPQSVKPSTGLISDLKVSIVEEVSVEPFLGELKKLEPEGANATAKNLINENVVVTKQQVCENVQNLLEGITPAMQTAIYAPFNAKNAALSSEIHEKGTLFESRNSQLDFEHAKPSIMPYTSCLNNQTIPEEQVITKYDQDITQAKNANVIFEANTKNKVDVTNIMETAQTLMPQSHDLEYESTNEKHKHTIKTEKINKDTTVGCQYHTESQLQSTPIIEYKGLSLSQTVEAGKYTLRLTLSSSRKGVLLPLQPDPHKQNTYNTKQTTTNKIKTNIQFFTQIQEKPQTHNTHNKKHQHKLKKIVKLIYRKSLKIYVLSRKSIKMGK